MQWFSSELPTTFIQACLGWGKRVCINQCNAKSYNIENFQVRKLISAYSPHDIHITSEHCIFRRSKKWEIFIFPPMRFLACFHAILLLPISGATAGGVRPSPPSGSCLSREQPPQSGCYQEHHSSVKSRSLACFVEDAWEMFGFEETSVCHVPTL